jgi:hypothetical protein
MPEFVMFVLYHFSDFFSGRHIHISQRQPTVICSTFDTFCIATGAFETLYESGLGVREKKEIAITANGMLLRFSGKKRYKNEHRKTRCSLYL